MNGSKGTLLAIVVAFLLGVVSTGFGFAMAFTSRLSKVEQRVDDHVNDSHLHYR